MKRITTVLICVILVAFCIIGCAKKEVFCGWIDDTDALSVKLNRMNRSEVHNLLGEPAALLVGSESDVYLNSEEVGVFIHYDKNGEVIGVEEENAENKKEFSIDAAERCRIMNMLIGRTRDEIVKRYGEPDSVSKDLSVIKYKELGGVKVGILFNQNGAAEKISLPKKQKNTNKSESQVSNEDNKENPVALLNDITALRKKTTGMSVSDFLNLFGKPKGEMETDNCRVYFDSNKNCVFVYFDEQRKVSNVEKIEAANLMGKDYYSFTDEELLTVLMNELIGKTKEEMYNKYGRTRYTLTTPNAYGYNNLYGKQVYVFYDDHNVLQRIEINVDTNDFADKDISVIREKSIGLSPDDNKYFIDAYRGYVASKNCVVRLDSRGDAIVLYYGTGANSTINKVEKLDGEAIKVNGAKNEIEKMVTVLHRFSGKERTQIESELGKPDIKVELSENYVGYKNINGNKLMFLYKTDFDRTEMNYVYMY